MAGLRYDAGGEERRITLGETLGIGRSAENELTLADDQAVSGRHALVRRAGDGYVVEDLDSRNGTFLERDGKEQRIVMPTALQPGDVIRAGSARLTFELADAGEGTQIIDAQLTSIPSKTVVGRPPAEGEVPREPPAVKPSAPPRRNLMLLIAVCVLAAVLVVVLALVLAQALG